MRACSLEELGVPEYLRRSQTLHGLHSGNTTDRGMNWHRRGPVGSEVVQSVSVVVFKTHLDEPLSCMAWLHSWTCFEGCLKLPSNLGHTITLLLIHFVNSSRYGVFKENLCVATSVLSIEEQHWFTQSIGQDGELFGMHHPGVWETCSVQRLGFQKNAIVLGCLFLVWNWTKQHTPVSEWWQKAIVELSHFQTKGTDSNFLSAHMNSGCLFFFFQQNFTNKRTNTHPPHNLKEDNSCIKRLD